MRDSLIFPTPDFESSDDLYNLIRKNYCFSFSDSDSGFDKTVALMNSQRILAELCVDMYSYLMQSLQISNYLSYHQGKDFKSFSSR